MSSRAKFKVTQSNEELSSHSGIALLGDILEAYEIREEPA